MYHVSDFNKYSFVTGRYAPEGVYPQPTIAPEGVYPRDLERDGLVWSLFSVSRRVKNTEEPIDVTYLAWKVACGSGPRTAYRSFHPVIGLFPTWCTPDGRDERDDQRKSKFDSAVMILFHDGSKGTSIRLNWQSMTIMENAGPNEALRYVPMTPGDSILFKIYSSNNITSMKSASVALAKLVDLTLGKLVKFLGELVKFDFFPFLVCIGHCNLFVLIGD